MIFVLICANAVKYLFIPQSFLTGLKTSSTETTDYIFTDSMVEFEHSDINFHRYTDGTENYVFRANSISMEYQNIELDSMVQLYAYDHSDDALSYRCSEYSISNEDIKFRMYGDAILAYVKDNIPYYFFVSDINSMERNDLLISCCETMVIKCDWNYFEYCAEYLLKYDKDFIKPYIVNYAKGEFSDFERNLACNADINPEFIQNLAKKLS